MLFRSEEYYSEIDKRIRVAFPQKFGNNSAQETGEILSLVSNPSFNPSNRKNITDKSIFRNRASIDVFEPGSVIKPIAMAAIIESQKEDLDSVVETSPGWIEVAGYKTNDFKDYGKLNLSQIISLSSNVGMVKLCTDQEMEQIGRASCRERV